MDMLTSVLPLLLMFAIFYFLLIRPQQKKQKKVAEMQSNIKKDDRVITIGGFHGTIDSIDEDKVVLRAGDGARLTYERSAIREVVNP